MTDSISNTRRNVIKAIPTLGIGAAMTVSAKAATPDERIKIALAEIETALSEKHPEQRVLVRIKETDWGFHSVAAITTPYIKDGDKACATIDGGPLVLAEDRANTVIFAKSAKMCKAGGRHA